jgi:hypothetical protein
VRLIDAAPSRLHRILPVLLYATRARRAKAARIILEDIDSQRMVTRSAFGAGSEVALSIRIEVRRGRAVEGEAIAGGKRDGECFGRSLAIAPDKRGP